MKPNKKREHTQKYLDEATSKILEHKYLESEKAGRDLGQDACLDWIKKYAKIHRREFVDKHISTAEELIENAEKSLEKLKENPNIPQEIKDALEGIYKAIAESFEEIDTAKDTVEINDKDNSGVV